MRKPMRRLLIAGLLAAPLAAGLAACSPGAGEVTVSSAEYRPPLGGAEVGAGYFSIRSPQPDRILGVSSPAALVVEMHESVSADGTMRMERRETVELPAGKQVDFASGGLHLMIFSPAPVGAETTFPITIELESGTRLSVPFAVFGASGPSSNSDHH